MRWILAVLLAGCAPASGGSTRASGGSTRAPPGPLARPAAVAQASVLARLEQQLDLDGVVVGRTAARATLLVVFASWCGHCKIELQKLGALRAAHPRLRILGVNYTGHEEYAGRGSAAAVRTYVAASAPWLRVIPADDALFAALGRPPMVPTLLVFDHTGALAATYDRRARALPTAAELDAVLARLGAGPPGV